MAKARVKKMNLPDAPKPTKAVKAFDPREKERQQRLAEHRDLRLRIDEGKILCFWDKARVSKLRRLWEEGYTVAYIAREVGCSPKTAQGRLEYELKCGRIEKRLQRASPEQVDSIVNRFKAGESVNTISKEMKMSRYRITEILKIKEVLK